jgi:very-short-patch-repair endonuclease
MRKDAAPAERLLWSKLRNRQLGGFRFRRQQPIGMYIADFYCSACKLVVESDGDSHSDRLKSDENRDSFMREHGLTVLRFVNSDVFDHTDVVLEGILNACLHAARAGVPPSP